MCFSFVQHDVRADTTRSPITNFLGKHFCETFLIFLFLLHPPFYQAAYNDFLNLFWCHIPTYPDVEQKSGLNAIQKEISILSLPPYVEMLSFRTRKREVGLNQHFVTVRVFARYLSGE